MQAAIIILCLLVLAPHFWRILAFATYACLIAAVIGVVFNL